MKSYGSDFCAFSTIAFVIFIQEGRVKNIPTLNESLITN